MTHAGAALLRTIEILDQHGIRRDIQIPSERPLTVFVDKRELVTLMTLGVRPELLVLGYLFNQRLLTRLEDVEAISVDWEVEAAAVKMRSEISDFESRTEHRIVTTGCGQGTVFGDAMGAVGDIKLPDKSVARITQRELHGLLDRLRHFNSVHREAGSVHGCALFHGSRMLVFAEDVGRHNAIDTIAGWMLAHEVNGADKVFFTTGRLTSEMVIKAAQMGIPIVVSRNGVTAMGYDLATRLGMTLFGRAANRHFLCYTGSERFDSEAGGDEDATAMSDTAPESAPELITISAD